MAQIAKNSFSIFVVALAVTVFSFVAVRSAAAQTVKSSIQKMSGWQSCSTCAGSGGSGPTSHTSTSAGISSPSMSGDSRVFTIAGTKAYSDALWWKQLGAANGATHLVYNLYFYLKTPQDAQAIEFDSNQANGHMRWIFGTQCDIARGRWEVYANAQGSWTSTGIPCRRPSAYKWHHLIWEFSRTSTKLTFLSVTLDGSKHYVNRTYTGKASSVSELNVAFQLDQNANHVAYSAWLDNVSLKYW